MSDQFTCDNCGKTFAKVWTDEEAQAEAEDIFGDSLGLDLAIVCDDCWRRMMAPLS